MINAEVRGELEKRQSAPDVGSLHPDPFSIISVHHCAMT